MHLRLFSDFSHKHFVTYSRSVPKERRALLKRRLLGWLIDNHSDAALDEKDLCVSACVRSSAAHRRGRSRPLASGSLTTEKRSGLLQIPAQHCCDTIHGQAALMTTASGCATTYGLGIHSSNLRRWHKIARAVGVRKAGAD